MDETAVEVSEHKNLNQIKGTIHYKNQPGYTDQEITNELKRQNVAEVYNIKKRESGILQRTNIYIVTFDACILPQDVTIGWTRCSVREYIPAPRRCYKCNRFGHGSNSCRQENSLCVRCGEAKHGERCEEVPKCSNCSEQHPASSRDCFYYQLEQETLTVQTREKISYSEAKRRATDCLVKPESSYANIVSNVLNAESSAKKVSIPKGFLQQRIDTWTNAKSSVMQQPNGNSANVQRQSNVLSTIQQNANTKRTTQQSNTNLPKSTPQSTANAKTTVQQQNAPKKTIPPTDTGMASAISTVISSRTNESKKPDTMKRDGSVMEDPESSEAGRKRGNYSQSKAAKPSPSSDQFPTPSPVLQTRHVSRAQSVERGNTSRNSNQAKQGTYMDPMEY